MGTIPRRIGKRLDFIGKGLLILRISDHVHAVLKQGFKILVERDND